MLKVYLDEYTGNEDVIHNVNEGILMIDVNNDKDSRELIETI